MLLFLEGQILSQEEKVTLLRLATQIGTRLEGIIYVLDEPSIGLHPRDNEMLIKNLKRLATIGNSVIVVEHDEDIAGKLIISST